jgi:glucose-1-phosphate adenylyltransferase
MPGNAAMSLASMGNYLFSTGVLTEILEAKGHREKWHDFGGDIIPHIIGKNNVYAYDFTRNTIPGMLEGELNCYWRDVGTLEAFFEANMELRSVQPPLNLYNEEWPIRSVELPSPPAKFVFNDEGRRGTAIDSIVSCGTIVSGGSVMDSVIGPSCRISSHSEVRESVLFEGVTIGRNCRIRRAIIDKNVDIPEGTVIGYDRKKDAARYHVSDTGIVVIPKVPDIIRLRDMRS